MTEKPILKEDTQPDLTELYKEIESVKGSRSYQDYERLKKLIPPVSPQEYQRLIRFITRKLDI